MERIPPAGGRQAQYDCAIPHLRGISVMGGGAAGRSPIVAYRPRRRGDVDIPSLSDSEGRPPGGGRGRIRAPLLGLRGLQRFEALEGHGVET